VGSGSAAQQCAQRLKGVGSLAVHLIWEASRRAASSSTLGAENRTKHLIRIKILYAILN
jgi:hypothetical protein